MKKIIINIIIALSSTLSISQSNTCDKIIHQYDKFENREFYFTPTIEGIDFTKVKTNDITEIYMSVSVNSHTLNIGKKGAYILLENGVKIIKLEEKIGVSVDKNMYKNNTIFKLDKNDITLLTNYNITDIKVGIFDKEINISSSQTNSEFLKCLLN